MAEANIRHFGNSLFREIHKNTWLTKIPSKDPKKKKRVWTVFCVHDDTEVFLETYFDNKSAISHKPEWFICLNNTKHVSPTICAHEQEYEFVITLSTDVVRLAAPTRELMLDWVESLRAKLYELKILSPRENIYSKLPESRTNPLLPTRDPTSPLPPPPSIPPTVPPGVEPLISSEFQNEDRPETNQTPLLLTNNHRSLQRGISLPEGTNVSDQNISEAVVERNEENVTIIQVEGNSTSENDIFNFDLNNLNVSSSTNASICPGSAPPPDARNTYYERLFNNQQPGPSNRAVLVQRSNSSPRRLQPAPQPYRTLREQQVLQLQKEMKHPAGVRLQLRRKDCINSIALADAMGHVWVCGWKQKEHPMLYNALHIGDQLLNIEGISIQNVNDANKILRSICSLYVNVIIKRVPFGQVLVIRRDFDGQSLGIIQEGSTAVIQTVENGSLAAKHGLSAKARTCDGLSFTNWVLTEINGRPLNLFFKDNQVRDRLNSVGRDISILVQPLDLIKQLKKQMKSLRNYKDYLLQ
ncbi:uncharacterized protein LOC108733830 [Agrilus planipennis]|uniref:Uncharacterized protein LOC108733830 n=1 Tax=Agrilus planipennis TaxID=224129 RepID=A0A1W4WKU6_AGRPL|nr:uncharacterized protein LOC108733830 [Agrilus planipennis]